MRPLSAFSGGVEMLDQWRRLAAARKARIETGEVGQRTAEPAQADGEANRRIFGQRDLGPRAVQAREKARGPDLRKNLDRRQVEGLLQRLARGDGALIAEIEILGGVGAVTRGPVEQDGLGMGEALFECERVDEGL